MAECACVCGTLQLQQAIAMRMYCNGNECARICSANVRRINLSLPLCGIWQAEAEAVAVAIGWPGEWGVTSVVWTTTTFIVWLLFVWLLSDAADNLAQAQAQDQRERQRKRAESGVPQHPHMQHLCKSECALSCSLFLSLFHSLSLCLVLSALCVRANGSLTHI